MVDSETDCSSSVVRTFSIFKRIFAPPFVFAIPFIKFVLTAVPNVGVSSTASTCISKTSDPLSTIIPVF